MIKFNLALLCALCTSCANPTSVIKPDIERFKREIPQQIQTFQGKNRTMQYAWSGDPTMRAIIFVHGSPGSWDGWAHFLLDPVLQKNFHLIAIDRPGYGGSGEGLTETSLQSQAESILEVLQFNQSHEPAILVGHSYGGPVIARAAMDQPKRVGGLIFVASSVDPDLEAIRWVQYPATWWPIRVLIPDMLRVCNEEILPLRGELTKMLPLWNEITAKSILIQGLQDDLVPPANLDFLIKHLRASDVIQIVRVPDLNHFVPWKRPDLITDAILLLNRGLRTDSVASHNP